MIKIKTSGDLKEIKESALISAAYYRAVAEQFWQLVTTFCPPGSKPEEYSLEQDGYLVILTADDDHWCLEEAGLTFGLINSWPEYIGSGATKGTVLVAGKGPVSAPE